MAVLAFQKPEKVIMLEADDKYGKFEFRPLEPGFGITIGNSQQMLSMIISLSLAFINLVVYLVLLLAGIVIVKL